MGNDVVPRRLDELPPLAPETIQQVRESLARFPEDPVVLARVFYEHLFEMAPGLRGMFPQDMSAQEEKLLNAILSTVRALDDLGAVEVTLRRWGAAHRRVFGVTDPMYVYVGHALVRTVKVLLSDSTAVLSSWVAVYEWMAAVMIAGAEAEKMRAAHRRRDDRERAPSHVTPSVVGRRAWGDGVSGEHGRS